MKRLLSLLTSLLLAAAAVAQPIGTPEAPNYRRTVPPIDTTVAAPAWIQASPLYRKTMVIIGDSYVANHRDKTEHGWSYLVAQKYQMDYHNYGRNGGCIVFDRARWGKPMLERYVELPTRADYVIVVAGHNDADYLRTMDLPDSVLAQMSGAQRAAMSDSLLGVFRSGLSAFIDALTRRYPEARVAFVTPWNVDRAGFPEMLQTLRDTCQAHSVPLYDAAARSGILVRDAAFRRIYFQGPNDTAHLNAAGHRRFMTQMEAFLLGL